ncbi:MAG: FIST C-terminal domain-containing protein [Rhodocyclales bacterium]|nr:FIST C-terminal domain-containing protein [Rhodocyclales bacterium]
MSDTTAILRSQSCASDTRQAVKEFHAGVQQPDMELVVFFCSSMYDLEALADEMNRLFTGVQVIGCTTAGEIGPAGYRDHSIAGVSFSSRACSAVSGALSSLKDFEFSHGRACVQDLLRQLESRVDAVSPANTFAFLLVDGLSVREEPVVRTLQAALGDIPLCGGSAGDDLKFEQTWVFHNGLFQSDCAALALINTALPFKVFKTQHFVCEDERLVVTEADAAQRIVKEINGLPAAEEYARVLGVDVGELGPSSFATRPVVVVIDGTDYVRSIQKANPDGTLTFYCAIEDGLVLRVAHGQDIVRNLTQAFDTVSADIGPPMVTFGCDCILRNLEMTSTQTKQAAGDILRRNNTIGFSTYGEQFGGVHVNQTFTGIAIGRPRDEHHDPAG